MNEENKPMIVAPWSVEDVLKKIPTHWRSAQFLIGSNGNVVSNLRIKRIIFEINHDGSQVVILSPRKTPIDYEQ